MRDHTGSCISIMLLKLIGSTQLLGSNSEGDYLGSYGWERVIKQGRESCP
jgi:hypothetical protein